MDQTIDQLPDLPLATRVSGKVRESYCFDNNIRAIVVTDRISAFDYVLGTIPLKGHILNAVSNFWFEEIRALGIRSHHISSPHPNVSLNVEVDILPVEFVVRGYLTGSTITSSWYAYQNNGREICGIQMPAGMKKNEPFSQNILTPSTKADKGGRDINISKDDIIAQGIISGEIFEQAEETALKMFAHGQKIAEQKGLVLVDTKYEMGLTREGELIVADEVHTPDSSRYWIKSAYAECMADNREPESLDKEFVRNMIVNAGYDVASDVSPTQFMTNEIRLAAARKYLKIYEIFLGSELDYQETGKIEDAILSAAQIA